MAVAPVSCDQPGCKGTIEDGYCNVCGSPPNAAHTPPAAHLAPAAPNVAPATPSGEAPAAGRPAPGSPAARAAVTKPIRTATGDSTSSRTASSSHRLASAPVGSQRASQGTSPTRRMGMRTRRQSSRLGAGITTVPSEPITDPMDAIMVNPSVSQDKRFCPACESPVGRSRDGHPGRSEGFCPKCRTPFSFSPKLQAGDVIGGQYEVAGCLAHGGLGWVYLARDRNVNNRYVVLKGLLNSGDVDAYQAAVTERQFLAEVEHPLILEIYNFVLHEGAGYIVMEYVGGKSLKTILKDRMRSNNGRYNPIPTDQAIAYIIEILPAFSYLHATGLLYCDFKPDNIIQQGDAIKLIDLGGVRRVDDMTSAIYGTVGYQAPEVPKVGPSVAGDIYTIGRTLAVLAMELRGYQSSFVDRLPAVEDTPLFQQHDSLYRLLLKACATNPDDRFQSADEMREQLLGVLREVVASTGPAAAGQSVRSSLFDAPAVAGDSLTWQNLPLLKVDPTDNMADWLEAVSVPDPFERLAALDLAPEHTIEVRLARSRASIEAGQHDVAEGLVTAILTDDPWEWRALWLAGILHLARSDVQGALASFNATYGQVPGELAPKLALAVACERAGQPDAAEQLYLVCTRTDANYTAPAAFGIARIRRGRGDGPGALESLDLVPPTSRSFVDARRQRATLLVSSHQGLPSLADAIDSVASVSIDPKDRQELTIQVLVAALDEVKKDGDQPHISIGGIKSSERSLRDGLETAYRQLAAMTDARERRIELVDAANRVRRRTVT